MSENILILGGTEEAAVFAKQLVEKGHNVTTSLAGRTKEPAPLASHVRTGGFGGAEGLANWITKHNITKLIDATHPFAEQISKNAKKAAAISGVSFQLRQRVPWNKQDGDHWIEVNTLEDAAALIPTGARVLLALGSQRLWAFERRNDVYFLIRMIDAPGQKVPIAQHKLVLGKPSSSWEQEAELLKREDISHIVCRNSGGNGAYAKIEAARKLSIAVIILNRR